MLNPASATGLLALLVLTLTTAAEARAQTTDFTPCALFLDRPLRAVHISGNWAENMANVEQWEDADRAEPLIPSSHVEWLNAMHVNWIGISVALHIDDSMDSRVERAYSPDLATPTFSDDALRQMIREFRQRGFNVYLTLAFEAMEAEEAARPVQRWQLGDPGDPVAGVPQDDPAYARPIMPEFWPWRPSHPDHARFVTEFWRTYTEQAVHFAMIAQEEGVRMLRDPLILPYEINKKKPFLNRRLALE